MTRRALTTPLGLPTELAFEAKDLALHKPVSCASV